MIATCGNGHSASVTWSCVAFRMSPACTNSTQGGKEHSLSSRLQDQGHIDYNIPKAKMFRTLGTSRTCASFIHEKISGEN
jgi:hypothetical protein